MRHRKAGYKLTVTRSHRSAMMRNLAAGLFEHGQITTTVVKAKAVQPFVEKIITDAKDGSLAARRRVISKLGGDRLGFDWLYLPKDATDAEKQRVENMKSFTEAFFDLPKAQEGKQLVE